jgi:predicted nucleic acid-binding protein
LTTSYVLDASVAAKWFLPAVDEPLTGEALRLLRLYAKAQVGLLVPDLFFPEFSNIFWKAERRGRCNASVTDAAVIEILRGGFLTFPTSPLIQPAIQIARAYSRAVYDCVYIALAVETNTHLVTADQKLANSVPGMPVTWLGLI